MRKAHFVLQGSGGWGRIKLETLFTFSARGGRNHSYFRRRKFTNKDVKTQNYDIVKIHTDCVVANIPVDEMHKIHPINGLLGNFKLESNKISPEKTYQLLNINSTIGI